MEITVYRSNLTVTANDGGRSREHICKTGYGATILVRKLRANPDTAVLWLDGANPDDLNEEPPPAPAT